MMEIEISLQVLTFIAAFYMVFFKSYLTEKGKSLALKEDLDKLTRAVERVKNEFVREQEILKFELKRLQDNEISYRTEEREALIQFHSTITEWLFTILEVNIGNYSRINLELLAALRSRIATFYAKAGVAKCRIELLVDDEKIVQVARNLYVEALRFHNWATAEYLRLLQNLEMQKLIIEQYLSNNQQLDNNKDLALIMAKDETELKKEVKEIKKNYLENINPEYFKVRSPEAQFSSLVRKYLKT